MKKRLSTAILCVMIATMVFVQSTPAKSKDVTKKYKSSVSKMLKHFDGYFGYSCASGVGFKFNDYTRTMMIFHSDLVKYTDNLSIANKRIKPKLKTFFNKKKVKFHKDPGYRTFPDASWLWVNNNGRLRYQMGNWGLYGPRGIIRKITKTSSKKFKVNYLVRWYDESTGEYGPQMGEFTIYLKKKSGKNKFYIKKIVRTKTNNVGI